MEYCVIVVLSVLFTCYIFFLIYFGLLHVIASVGDYKNIYVWLFVFATPGERLEIPNLQFYWYMY